jgi:predicted transcriptional regulator
MSSKTRTRTTRTTATTGTAPTTLRSVPVQPTTVAVRTDTEDKLWAALHTNPNSTAADLSAAAKIGKSTAQKILVKWAGDGSVTRTPGIADGGRRAADVWSITEADSATAPDTASNGGSTVTDGAPPDERTVVEDAAPAHTTPDEPTITPASTEQTELGDGVAPDDAPETASGEEKAEKAERLAPGALRGMVEDWLRDHPGEQAGPTKIAKDLGGKSSGAVSNALDKLVADGVAAKTQDTPRRFGLAPAQQEAAAAPAN